MTQIEGSSGDNSTTAQTSATSEAPNDFDELDLNDLILETKNLCFTYDHKKGDLLNKINITLPRRAIYGFLGPSGCGKTTVIKLIMGQLKPLSGSIRVNGKSITDPSNKIPGVGVGYMPQEYALYSELTIKETLNYFAGIYGISSDYKKKRIEFLIKFLELPNPNRLTGVLSGGQKRRTSFAIALIHNPKLLILDEPTVGVDPMLRERIWEYLVYLSAEEKTSIMITTHYIDECQRADIIALMRGGHLLVENTPSVLLKHFQTNNLEDVFLEVCRSEEQQKRPNLPLNLSQVKESKPHFKDTNKFVDKKEAKNKSFNSTFCGRYLSLVQKNATKLIRQKLYILVLLLVPIISTVLICTTFGKRPYNLKVAVYNQEVLENTTNKFSKDLIDKIDKKIINLEYYNSNQSALDSVRDGKTFGALIVNKNFSSALLIRSSNVIGFAVSDEVIKLSSIQFFADTTDLMIFEAMFQTLMSADLAFRREVIEKYDTTKTLNIKSLEPIISFIDPPIYGSLNPEFRDFGAPGLLILIVFVFSMAVTLLDIVGERTERTLDRTLVAGVKIYEMLLALITVQLVILIIQIVCIIILVFYVFDVKNEGNLALVIAIMLTQGLQGMACGLFLSTISYDELMAIELCVGIFLPLLIISGVLWPLEGMHYLLRTISLFTPQTLPILSLRNIMLKGWGLKRILVWNGFFASIGFFFFFIVLSTIASNFVKYK